MKEINWKRVLRFSLLILLAACVVFAGPRLARAGFGDFDSGSDYGGSRRSDSDSDSDDLDLFFLIRLAADIGELLGISPVVTVLLMLILVAFFKFGLPALRNRSGGAAHESPRTDGAVREGQRSGGPPARPETLQRLREVDPGFDAIALAQRVWELYEKMQDCWEQGNIDALRYDFTPDTWTRFNTQLQNKNAVGETSHVRNIVFDDVLILDYGTDAEHQILRIRVEVTHNVWTTDREGKRVQGTERTRKRFKYLWTMVRPLGSTTGGRARDAGHCPNCGAELDLEAFAECPFCHTPILQVSPDWVISEIDALSQTTLQK